MKDGNDLDEAVMLAVLPGMYIASLLKGRK